MKIPTLDSPETVSTALADELERLNMEHGMVTGRPWIDPVPAAGEPLVPALLRLAFTDQALARSIAEREGFDGAAFVELFRGVEESTRAGKPFLVSAIGKVGETVAEHPLLLFGAPFVVAALTGAFGAAGAAGANVSAAESAIATSAPSAAASAPVAAAEAAAAGTAAAKASALLPKIVGGINAARTIEAVASGEAPPPPLSVEGEGFLELGTSLGMSVLSNELAKRGEKLSAEEAARAEVEMRHAIEEYQRRLLASGVRGGDPRAAGVSEASIAAAVEAGNRKAMTAAALVAAGLLIALISRR